MSGRYWGDRRHVSHMEHKQLPISPVAGGGQGSDLCVARVPLFQGLGHEAQLEVAAVAQPTRVAKGQQVYAAGADASQLLVVHAGQIKLSRISVDGHEQVVRVLGPGDFVGEGAFLHGGKPDHFATALTPGSMCVFRHRDLGRLVEQHPSIGLRMLKGVSLRLREAENRLAAITSGDVRSRLAGYLLALPAKRQGGEIAVRLPLAKKDIASLLDTTPESLSRHLRRLQEAGLIDQDGAHTIVLTRPGALVALAGLEGDGGEG